MSAPLLSICIATYNRAAFIGETLEAIIPQVTDQVEIVVADGASTDNTAAVVEKYVAACKQIKYVNLAQKGGVDQDYNKAVELASGKMCWLFTDDDLIKPGAVEKLLSEIEKGYCLIVVNAETRSVDFSTLIREKEIAVTTDLVFDSNQFDELFSCTIPYLSFIGGVVINREIWLSREKERYYGTEFIHVGVLFQKPLPGKTLVMAQPYIAIRWGNAQWTSRSFSIWMIKWPTLLTSFTHLSENTRNAYSMSPSFKWVREMIFHRNQSAFTASDYENWLKAATGLPGWWKLVVKAISVLPVSVAKLIVSANRMMKTVKTFFSKPGQRSGSKLSIG